MTRSAEAERYRRWYKTARWMHTRFAHLGEHPLCQRHLQQGRIVAATVVHHVNPDKTTALAFFAGPFESLCAECHDKLAGDEERHGFTSEVGLDGVPIDQAHPFFR
jgi:5-methylcytosine-specific restriction enzyme A